MFYILFLVQSWWYDISSSSRHICSSCRNIFVMQSCSTLLFFRIFRDTLFVVTKVLEHSVKSEVFFIGRSHVSSMKRSSLAWCLAASLSVCRFHLLFIWTFVHIWHGVWRGLGFRRFPYFHIELFDSGKLIACSILKRTLPPRSRISIYPKSFLLVLVPHTNTVTPTGAF